jgi:hypothetical protein
MLPESTGATLSCPTIAPKVFGTTSVNRIGRIILSLTLKTTLRQSVKKQILQLANYLSQHGTGLLGIILTRTGDDSSAQYVRREQWMMHNKLILVLNDEDLIQMLL